MNFKEINELNKDRWAYEFYREEIYHYLCDAVEPNPKYKIRALFYSDGTVITLARLENQDDFKEKPELQSVLMTGVFDGHHGTIEECMNDTLWKIGNVVERALEMTK